MTLRKVQAEQLDLSSPNSEVFTTGGAEDLSLSDKIVVSDVSDGDKGKVATLQQLTFLVGDNISGPINYQGTWNAGANLISPGFTNPLPSAVGIKGYYYVVSTAGTQTPPPNVTPIYFGVGDWVVSNGSTWDKVDNTDQVSSVNGYQGVVVLTNTDVGAAPSSHVGAGGSAHAAATTSVAGFMPAADKTKVDAITFTGAATLAVPANASVSGTNTGDQTITLTGDVTGSGTGSFATTIGANKVLNSMLAQVATATFKGRSTAGTGNVEDMTGTQATALLDVFATSLKGLVPAPTAADANRVLLGNATWGRYNLRGYSGSVIALSDGTLAPETTVFSQTVPGGSLGTSGQVRVSVSGLIINSTGNRQYTIRVKYGGSTFFGDLTSNVATTANGAPFSAEFVITSTGATTTQSISGNIRIGVGTTGTVVGQGDLASTNVINAAFYGPSPGAVDSTVDQTVQITITSNSANTTQTFTLLNYAIEAR